MSLFPLRDWHFVAIAEGGQAEATKIEQDADPSVFTEVHVDLQDGAIRVTGKLASTSFGEVERCLEGIGITRLVFVEAD